MKKSIPSQVKDDAPQILRDYLKKNHITQRELAGWCNVPVALINQRLTGRIKFTADFAILVSRVLMIDLRIFLK